MSDGLRITEENRKNRLEKDPHRARAYPVEGAQLDGRPGQRLGALRVGRRRDHRRAVPAGDGEGRVRAVLLWERQRVLVKDYQTVFQLHTRARVSLSPSRGGGGRGDGVRRGASAASATAASARGIPLPRCSRSHIFSVRSARLLALPASLGCGGALKGGLREGARCRVREHVSNAHAAPQTRLEHVPAHRAAHPERAHARPGGRAQGREGRGEGEAERIKAHPSAEAGARQPRRGEGRRGQRHAQPRHGQACGRQVAVSTPATAAITPAGTSSATTTGLALRAIPSARPPPAATNRPASPHRSLGGCTVEPGGRERRFARGGGHRGLAARPL